MFEVRLIRVAMQLMLTGNKQRRAVVVQSGANGANAARTRADWLSPHGRDVRSVGQDRPAGSTELKFHFINAFDFCSI